MSARSPLSLTRRFTRLAVPNILSNLTVPMVGLVDTAMLGHLPDIRFLAGVALGAVLFDYVYWTFGFLRMGTTGTTAQAVGRGREDEVWQILYRSVVVAVGIAAVLLVMQRVIAWLGFALLSGGPGVEAAGRDYFDARIWAAPATLTNFVILGWLLGRERARAALLMTVVANVCNVALDWLLILKLGLAAWGAGAATAASQYLMLAVGLALVFRDPDRRAARLRAILDRERLGELFRLNRDILVRTLCLISTFALFTNFSAVLGTTVLAANAILLRLLGVASYLIDGAAFATESLAGIYQGQGDREGLGRLLRLAMATGCAFGLLLIAGLMLFPGPIFAALTSHPEIRAAADRYVLWMVPVLVFGAVAYILDGFFLGLTAGRVLRNAMITSTVVFFLPLGLWALRAGDNHLLWAALALYMIGRDLTLGARVPAALGSAEGTT
jgi:MATE family multidrug resistance protein